jgi:hypothetical protein
MAFEQKPNTGSLRKNDRKTEDKHPNAKGSALIGGIDYWVAAWTKKDKNGDVYQSLSFTPKDEARADEAGARMKQATKAEEDVDLPF